MTTPNKLALAAVCVLACCLLAACGSSSSTSSSSIAAASGTSASATRTKLVACLKQHGVTLRAFRRPGGGAGAPYGGGAPGSAGSGSRSGGAPGAGVPPGGGGFFSAGGGTLRSRLRDNSKLQAAFKACGAKFGAGRFRFNPAARKAEINNFVKCVDQHGYKLPKPNFSGGPVFPRSIESDKKFQAASKACASVLRPAGAAQGGATPPGGAPPSGGAAGTAGGLPQS